MKIVKIILKNNSQIEQNTTKMQHQHITPKNENNNTQQMEIIRIKFNTFYRRKKNKNTDLFTRDM